MHDWLQSLVLVLLCAGCGGVGAVLGLGGGMLVVPLLVFGWGMELSQAAATSLVGCLATSAGGSLGLERANRVDAAVVAELEVFAAAGALLAASLALRIPSAVLAALFAAVSLLAAWRILQRELLRGTAPGPSVEPRAPGRLRQAAAWALAFLAGGLSSLLGIGGGPVKVPLQTELLGLSLPVALANSNLMVGITSAFGAAVYYGSGQLRPEETAAACVGMAGGSYVGGRLVPYLRVRWLAAAFVLVLGYLAVRMLWKAIGSAS